MGAARHIEQAVAGGPLEPLSAADLTDCIGCGRPLKQASHPLFSRFFVKTCGMDNRAAVLGGDFSGFDPARVVESFAPVNVCRDCTEGGITVGEVIEKVEAQR